jgi:DNA-binding NarL/FixJ family response regulator
VIAWPRIVLIHHDTPTLRRLAAYLETAHEFVAVDNIMGGVKYVAKIKPEVIVVGHDAGHQDAAKRLIWMRDNRVKAAVVAVYSADAASSQPMLVKLGAKALVPDSVTEPQLQEAIRTAQVVYAAQQAAPPSISEDERNGNLSMMETQLNKQMKCFAGTNQVFLQSRLLGQVTTRPRLMLRCPIRPDYGMPRDVYYEYIRDVCCKNPMLCEAHRRFTTERESA